jgi:hypothetical protein
MGREGLLPLHDRMTLAWRCSVVVLSLCVLVGASMATAAPAGASDASDQAPSSVVVPDVMASWWSVPRTAYLGAPHDTTFGTGIASDGTAVLVGYEHRTDEVHRVPLRRFAPNDHVTPAVLAPADRPLMVFYADHNRDPHVYFRVARGVGSTDLGPERRIDFPGRVTYAQAYQGAHPDELLLVVRVGNTWWLARSADLGNTWTQRPFFEATNARGYLLSVQLPDRSLRFAAYGHPTSPLRSLYVFELTPAGELIASSGERIAHLDEVERFPLSQADLVDPYEPPEGASSRLFDVSAAEHPELLIAEWVDDGPATYVHLDLGEEGWQRNELIGAGAPIGFRFATRYLAGGSFPNPTTGGELYLAREEAGRWSVEHWLEGEAAWSSSELASSTANRLGRPSAPVGGDDIPITWLEIQHYSEDTYTDYRSDLVLRRHSVRPAGPHPGDGVAGDWNGDGRTQLGTFDRGIWRLQLSGEDGLPAESVVFRFGRAGDVPVVGDWNGDGRDTIGVRRGNTWLLRDELGAGPFSRSFTFGRSTDIPVVGDWNGDGRDTIGVLRGRTWYLRDAENGGPATHVFGYGRSGDEPIVGDWNGNGQDTVGVRRGNTWLLRDSLVQGPATRSFLYGRSTDEAHVGSWSDTVGSRPALRRDGIWVKVVDDQDLERTTFVLRRTLF